MFIINRKPIELYSPINNGSPGLGPHEEAPSDLRAYRPLLFARDARLLAGGAFKTAGDVPPGCRWREMRSSFRVIISPLVFMVGIYLFIHSDFQIAMYHAENVMEVLE